MTNGDQTRVLVIDDDPLIISTVSDRLEREGYAVVEAADGQTGVERFRQGVDVVLLDYSLPDMSGQEVLRRMRMEDPEVPVIMMTAHGTVPRAVEMMKEGVFHFTPKSSSYLEEVLREVAQATRGGRPARPRKTSLGLDAIIGRSPETVQLRTELGKLADAPDPLVVIGDSGTGKRFVAEALHGASSRAKAPFVVFECAALAPEQLDAELFGRDLPGRDDGEAGALERADGGTIVLSRVGHLAPALQSKLLHLLQTGRFVRRDGTRERRSQARILATCNRSLREVVRTEGFSSELCLALGGGRPIEVAALTARPDDIPPLAQHFLQRYATALGRPVERFDDASLEFLRQQTWPGNVRELKNLVERAVLRTTTEHVVDLADLVALSDPAHLQGFVLPRDGANLSEVERSLVKQALDRTSGNRTQAGHLLGLNRDQVRYRINKFDLEGSETDDAESAAPR